MEIIWNFENVLISWIQNRGAWLMPPMQVFSFLGNELFYLLVMPIIYWCIDSRLGIRIGAMVILSNGLNFSLKLAFHSPRPYWLDQKVFPLSSETSFGMPSGHAQNAASIWGLLASSIRSRRGKSLIVVGIVLIGFSRLYLGVHFISDVLAGLVFGSIFLWIFLKYEGRLSGWLKNRSFFQNSILSLLGSVVILVVPLLIRFALSGWGIPQVWIQNASRAASGSPIDPMGISNAISLAGVWLGMAMGINWVFILKDGYTASGSPAQKFFRYLIGMAGLLLIYVGLDKIFPDTSDLAGNILRFIRYALVGLWITGIAPIFFKFIGKSSSRKKEGWSYNLDE